MRRLLIALACLAACAAPPQAVDGIWIRDSGETVIIRDGAVLTREGRRLGTLEVLDGGIVRYTETPGPDGAAFQGVLEVAFPDQIRMTWSVLTTGEPLYGFMRVADAEP